MIEIRPLRADDNWADLIALSRAFFAEYEAHHPYFFQIDHLADDDVVAYFSRWLENDDGRAFVAVEQGHVVGYITVYVYDQPGYWQVKRAGEISGLMVHPDYRHQGIASQLLDRVRAFLADRQVKHLTVYTAVANSGALEFYRRSGLEPLYTTLLGQVDPLLAKPET